jgi:hypothetical protein
MRRAVWMVFVLMLVGFVSAVAVDVSVVGDVGKYSGAYLQVKASESGELGDKIYPNPDKYLKGVGIFKFEIETSLSEVFLNIVFIKDGSKVDEISRGPFDLNGSEINIDLREADEDLEVIKEVEAEEVFNETVENMTNVSVVEVESDAVDNGSGYLVSLTGWAMQDIGSGAVVYSVGGVVLLIVIIVIIVLFRKRRKKKVEVVDAEKDVSKVEKVEEKKEGVVEKIVDGDEMELREVEKRVKETEKRIAKLKDAMKKRGKIEAARKKLAKEEEELRRLQGKGTEEDFTEKVEDIDSF